MSSASDVLMYISPRDHETMDEFNALIAAEARFEAHPYQVSTKDFSGPNVFWGEVWAFGADYLLHYEVQEAIDKVRWKRPQNVVALVTWWDTHGICQTEVCRPKYRVEEVNAFYDEWEVVQEPPTERKRLP